MTRKLSVCWLLISAAAGFLFAENGRDFAGQYAFSSQRQSDGMVQATLTIRLRNHSGHDVSYARLVVEGLPEASIATPIRLANRGVQVVRTEISLSAREFSRWRQRGPILSIEWTDNTGSVIRRPVELTRAAAIPQAAMPEGR